jgi:signal transduction histidine kinase
VEAVDPDVQDPGVQAHLGVPLVDSEKHVLGVLCAGDRRPREWAADEVEALQDLAAIVVAEIELRRERIERARAERERSEATAARQALEAQLERAERVKSQFAAALRHEFGQPLTVIQGFSELLGDGSLSADEIQEYAAEINKEASHLSEIVANIRDMDQKVEEFAASRRPK